MPNQETVVKRSYLAIAIAVLTLIVVVISMQNSSPEEPIQNERPELNSVSLAPVYYPTGDPSLDVYVDESLVNKVASEPVQKTEEDRINEHIDYVCESYPNVTPSLVRSVIMSESSFNPKAKNGSHIGLMQVSTKWHRERAKRLGVSDLFDPYGNVTVGVDYLSELIDQTDGDLAWALMIYNMGFQTAYQLHQQGKVSSYASKILSRL